MEDHLNNENIHNNIKSVSDIKNVYYINLASRPDRKNHVEGELKKMGFDPKRFNAIKMANGAIGCSSSHCQLLKMALAENLDHILIVEDDIQFTNPSLFLNQMNRFFLNHKNWDVVLIAGNNMGDFKKIDDTCVRVSHCQTTTGYLVKKPYYETLIKNIEEGIQKLSSEPQKANLYAIDQHWSHLQYRDKWFLIVPLTVTQRADYSDIEKRPTNYSPAMLDLNKETFKMRQQSMLAQKEMKHLKFY